MSITSETFTLITTLLGVLTNAGLAYIAYRRLFVDKKAVDAEAAQDQATVIESSAKSAQQWLDVFAAYRADRIKSDEENIALRRRLAQAEDEIKRLKFQFEQKESGEQLLVEENKRLNADITDLRVKLATQEATHERERVSYTNEIGNLHLQLKELTLKIEALTPKGEQN